MTEKLFRSHGNNLTIYNCLISIWPFDNLKLRKRKYAFKSATLRMSKLIFIFGFILDYMPLDYKQRLNNVIQPSKDWSKTIKK